MDIYMRLKELGLELGPTPKAGGIYSSVVSFGTDLIYTSGNGCKKDGAHLFQGTVGGPVTLQQAQLCARQCILNILSNLHAYLGDLNRIEKIVKLLGFVACESSFHQQPQVMDAASQLLIDIFGEESGRAARSAIGTNSLPGDMPVEIEMVAQLKSAFR